MTTYGYKIHIWQYVMHNGKHSHTIQRTKTVHLTISIRGDQHRLKNMVRPRLSLKPASEANVHDGLVVSTDEEFIHSVECLGRAIPRVVYRYVKED